jgi:hypothetical protein
MPTNNEIKGNTLKVYLYILRHGPSELRDVQRGIGLSSPSLASYHLGKLMEAGFASQDEFGKYFALKDTSDKILDGYSKMGTTVVPQMFFFALLFTILAAFFSFMALSTTGFTIYLIGVCDAMVVVFWFETVRLWRKLAA